MALKPQLLTRGVWLVDGPQVLSGSFPGVSEFSPMLATDHAVGL
jgi:hypothetical protein